MAEPTAKDIERAREWAADGANEFTLTEILAVDHYAQGLADERARIAAWLRSQDWDRMGILHEAADALEADHE